MSECLDTFYSMSIKRERSRSLSSDRDIYERPSKVKMEKSRSSGSRSSASKKVYVSNINFDCSLEELKDRFNCVGEVQYVQMLKDEKDKRFKGCAIVSFKEPSMAQDAIDQLNRSEFMGRKLVVKEEDAIPNKSFDRDRKRSKNDFEPRPAALSLMAAQNYNLYGLSMTFLESLKIDLPLIETVFVANLDYDVDDKQLREVFSLAGNVINCEVFTNKDGKSRGFGIVEYEHPVEAVQAISMLHNQTYRDRTLTVRMDRSERKKESKPKLPAGLRSIGLGLGIDGMPLRDVKSLPSANPASSPIASASNVAINQLSPLGLASQMNQGSSALIDTLPMGNRINPGITPGLGATSGVGLNLSRDYGHGNYSPGTLGNIIQLTNLPLDYTSENLRKLCWPYGDVRLAEMRSQGAGMVKFRSEVDARRAVEILDRQPLEGRILNARLL